MAKDDYLTEKEERLLDALEIYQTIAQAARKVGVAASTGRAMLYIIRQKRIKSTNTVNRLNNRGKRDARVQHLLSPIRREAPKVEEESIPA